MTQPHVITYHFYTYFQDSVQSLGSDTISSCAMNVEHEIQLLIKEIKRLGTPNADGLITVKFGVLFRDDRCANLFEAMVGTLRAAKRKKFIMYEGELLLQGVNDNVDIVLLKE